MSSCIILTACWAGMLLASNFIMSLAFTMAYGSFVFFVVFTVIEPSTRLSSHETPDFCKSWIICRVIRWCLCSSDYHCLIDRWAAITISLGLTSRHFVTTGQTSLKYFSLYLGNNVAKDDSSRRFPFRLSGFHSSSFQWSISSVSQGLSFLYLLWFFAILMGSGVTQWQYPLL